MIELIGVAKTFNVRPSEMLRGVSSWEAYCFDVAAMVYVMKLEEGKRPVQDLGDATEWLL